MEQELEHMLVRYCAFNELLIELESLHEDAKQRMEHPDGYQNGYLHALNVAIERAEAKVEAEFNDMRIIHKELYGEND